MQKIYSLTLFALAGLSSSYAQSDMIEVPLSTRIQSSSVIFEGKVLDKVSFWNSERTHIFTANTVEVYKVFKGAISATRVEIVTEGGIVDKSMEIVTPSLTLDKDQTGIFLAKGASVINSPNSITGDLKFETVESTQGFLKYDLVDEAATDVFHKYTNIENQVYNAIISHVGGNFKVINSFDVHQLANANRNNRSVTAAAITSFSPTTITAGTGSVLTITGSGFGASNTGSAKVEFANADDGGGSYVAANASNITGWTDTQILVKVPQHQGCASGTGAIRVTATGGGTPAVSSSSLTITYGEINAFDNSNNEDVIKLANLNGSGGYNLQYNTTFVANTTATAAFDRAMETWRCATQRNFVHSGNTATTCNANENPSGNGTAQVNVVSFDAGCVLASGILGKTFSYFTACCTSSCLWILDGMDVIFSSNAAGAGAGWNYGPAATSGGKYDFESTALHELGHATLCGHVINAPKLMHWNRSSNVDVRTLDAAIDVACGADVVTRSIVSNACGKTAMTKSTATCATGITTNEVYDNSVSIYPNPFDNSATLHINADKNTLNVSVTMYDVLGKEVKHLVNIRDENVQLNRDNLPNGIYFYQVKNNDKIIATGKLVLSNGN